MTRILKFFGWSFLGLFAIIFLILGIWGWPIQSERAYLVNAPASSAYQYLNAHEYYPEWQSNYIRSMKYKGSILEPGSIYIHYIEDEGEESAIIDSVATANPPDSIYRIKTHHYYQMGLSTHFEKVSSDSTRISQTANLKGRDFFSRLLLPLYGPQILKEHFDDYLKGTRRIQERHSQSKETPNLK